MRGRRFGVLGDLFTDLRDRKLLPVVFVLIAAIIAVPLLLKNSSAADEGIPTAPVSPSVAGAEIVDPVVVSGSTEIRDFHVRLKQLQSRNPFEQQLTGSTKGADEAEAGGAGDEAASSPSAGAEPATDLSVESITDSGPVETEVIEEEPIEEEPIDPEPVDPDTEETETTLVTTRIDVRVGPVGDTKVIKDVKFLDFLPERRTPVVEYIQSDFDLTNAVFIVSPFVTTTEGEGKCAPAPQNCQFLKLEVGDEHSFQYDDGLRYRLKLLRVKLHEEPVEEEETVTTGRQADFTTSAPTGKVVGG